METLVKKVCNTTTHLQNRHISQAAEEKGPTPREWQERLGFEADQVIPRGRLCKLDFLKILVTDLA